MPIYLDSPEMAHPISRLFGARLKAERVKLGLTQAQLYEATGITASYISFIERGLGNPTLEMILKLAGAVGLEAWLMLRPARARQVP